MNLKKRKLYFYLLFLLLFLTSCDDNIINDYEKTEIIPSSNQITVYLYGEVKYPGLYNIEENSHLYELINLAGGFTQNAKIDNINLARIITNNEMIIIEKLSISNENNLININTGTVDDLMKLKGIGETKALAIVNYRLENGQFKKIEDLLNVKGISKSLFDEIKDKITI